MQSSSQQPRHTAPDPDPDVQEEQDGCGDVAATSTAAKPKQKKRRKKGGLGRHKNGQQKQSKTHDLPLPPPVPTPRASNNDTPDPRVWNMKRAIKRRDNKITTTKTQLDERVDENIQLRKKLKTVKAEKKAVQKEAKKEIDVAMKDMEQELKVAKESADKMTERANKKLKVAAEASGNAKVKAAAAAKESIEAKEKKKVKSKTAKLNEIKEQIRMRVLGLGWGDLHHAWSKDGTHYSVDHLASYLKNTIILEESRRDIPSTPPVKTLERKVLPVLGSLSADVAKLDVVSAEKKQEMLETAEKMRDEQELVGFGDRCGEMQPLHPPVVDEGLLDRRIEICETRGDQLHWHSGTVVGIFGGARKNSVEIHYDAAVLDEGEEPVQAVKLLKHYWNQTKHTTTGKGWRWAIEEVELARGEN
eukprot:scaffold4161_cov113-Skeletonema_dohrnii-CCMP3373.AAC.1